MEKIGLAMDLRIILGNEMDAVIKLKFYKCVGAPLASSRESIHLPSFLNFPFFFPVVLPFSLLQKL